MREKLVEEFMFYEIWNEYREYEQCNLDVENEEDVKLAVKKAYVDMMPRTIEGLGLSFLNNIPKMTNTREERCDVRQRKRECIEFKQKSIDGVLGELASNIVKVTKGEREFDQNKLCDDFEMNFKNALQAINNKIQELFGKEGTKIIIEKVKYGKAQKIVNMTFKYLMLFQNAGDEKYSSLFEKCHMPVDSFIVSYMKKQKIIDADIVWSNLDKDEYNTLYTQIKRHCEENSNLTGKPLYDDFIIWGQAHKEK